MRYLSLEVEPRTCPCSGEGVGMMEYQRRFDIRAIARYVYRVITSCAAPSIWPPGSGHSCLITCLVERELNHGNCIRQWSFKAVEGTSRMLLDGLCTSNEMTGASCSSEDFSAVLPGF
jgi:hypothetical protein